jgi:hypothetical protein
MDEDINLFEKRVVLNHASGAFVHHTKNRVKHKINIDKDNFLYFKYIECTNFETKFSYLCD